MHHRPAIGGLEKGSQEKDKKDMGGRRTSIVRWTEQEKIFKVLGERTSLQDRKRLGRGA